MANYLVSRIRIRRKPKFTKFKPYTHLKIRVSNAWKNVTNVSIYHSGVWKTVTNLFIKKNQ